MIGAVSVPHLENTINSIYIVVLFTIPLLTSTIIVACANYIKIRKALIETRQVKQVALDHSATLAKIQAESNGATTDSHSLPTKEAQRTRPQEVSTDE